MIKKLVLAALIILLICISAFYYSRKPSSTQDNLSNATSTQVKQQSNEVVADVEGIQKNPPVVMSLPDYKGQVSAVALKKIPRQRSFSESEKLNLRLSNLKIRNESLQNKSIRVVSELVACPNGLLRGELVNGIVRIDFDGERYSNPRIKVYNSDISFYPQKCKENFKGCKLGRHHSKIYKHTETFWENWIENIESVSECSNGQKRYAIRTTQIQSICLDGLIFPANKIKQSETIYINNC